MFRTLVAAAVFAAPAVGMAAQWDIDGSHTRAGFSVKHLVVTTVRGEFGKISGTVSVDDKDVSKSTMDVTIDAASIDTRDAKRDDHLKSPDFFDTAKTPNITFKSTKVEKGAQDKFKVTGNLTMRGVSKPVTLDVTFSGKEVKDPWGNVKTGGSATAVINREDWGLNWNKALEAGGFVVGKDVTIEIDFELNKKVAPKS